MGTTRIGPAVLLALTVVSPTACSGVVLGQGSADAASAQMGADADSSAPAAPAIEGGSPATSPAAPPDASVADATVWWLDAGDIDAAVSAEADVANAGSLDAGFLDASYLDAGSGADNPEGCSPATVSFARDVIPAFAQTCTLSSVCHGQMNNDAEEDLYLGDNDGMTNVTLVYNQIVNAKAKEIPSMDLVRPGDVNQSFLWRKLLTQDDLMTLSSQCMAATTQCVDCNQSTPCGATMPYLSDSLSSQYACLIWNWIRNGAQND